MPGSGLGRDMVQIGEVPKLMAFQMYKQTKGVYILTDFSLIFILRQVFYTPALASPKVRLHCYKTRK